MQRFAIALAAVFAVASSAQAVSVAITADQPSYLPGETITLSVIVDATGDGSGAVDTEIYGRFSYDTAILTGGSVSQNALSSGGGFLPWILGSDGCSDQPGFCISFNQLGYLSPLPVDQPAGFVISTITFTAGAVGSTDLVWWTGPQDYFDFFGLTDAPGTTVQVVPEPATAVLLALGLVALGAARRAES